EDEDDILEWNSKAGRVYGVDEDVRQRWLGISSKQEGDSSGCYGPFTSRLEWEICQWSVKEKISQSSFNRFLKIPQVQDKLGLTFNTAKSMLDKLDETPDRAGPWFTKKLSFKDRPEEEFTIYHRDPVEAIKALWGDPSLANDLVYQPGKLFRSKEQTKESRIFSEMWTANF
ncbi:hypothetical protein C8R42DRAFT_549791, partial [Lentinula raphanica]